MSNKIWQMQKKNTLFINSAYYYSFETRVLVSALAKTLFKMNIFKYGIQ